MPALSETYSPSQQLDLSSLHELPDSHAWPIINHPNCISVDDSIPVVDLRHPDVVACVSHASLRWGVFQVVGHGIPIRLLDLAISECRRLFSLPHQQKLKASRLPGGLSGYGVARISSFFDKLMWSEGFTVAGSSVEHAKNLWPHDYRNFCDVMEEYEKEMAKLAKRMMRLMLASLGLSERDVEGLDLDPNAASAVVQLNSYPACPEPDRAMGLAAHTDSSLLTIIYQSNTRGLQVLRPNDDPARWITVPPIHEALVVNVGDLFQILSNGRYRSVLHRAVVHRFQHRFSVAYIYGPAAHVKLSPPERLLRPGENLVYGAVTWPEYLKLKALHFNKALEMAKSKQGTM